MHKLISYSVLSSMLSLILIITTSMILDYDKKLANKLELIVYISMSASCFACRIICILIHCFVRKQSNACVCVMLLDFFAILCVLSSLTSFLFIQKDNIVSILLFTMTGICCIIDAIYMIMARIRLAQNNEETQDILPKNIDDESIIENPKEFYLTITDSSTYLEEQCPICINNYELGEQLRILECKHCFHISCIDEWLQKKSTCPLCRQNTTDTIQVITTI